MTHGPNNRLGQTAHHEGSGEVAVEDTNDPPVRGNPRVASEVRACVTATPLGSADPVDQPLAGSPLVQQVFGDLPGVEGSDRPRLGFTLVERTQVRGRVRGR